MAIFFDFIRFSRFFAIFYNFCRFLVVCFRFFMIFGVSFIFYQKLEDTSFNLRGQTCRHDFSIKCCDDLKIYSNFGVILGSFSRKKAKKGPKIQIFRFFYIFSNFLWFSAYMPNFMPISSFLGILRGGGQKHPAANRVKHFRNYEGKLCEKGWGQEICKRGADKNGRGRQTKKGEEAIPPTLQLRQSGFPSAG